MRCYRGNRVEEFVGTQFDLFLSVGSGADLFARVREADNPPHALCDGNLYAMV